jgi:hypothetical protein
VKYFAALEPEGSGDYAIGPESLPVLLSLRV